MCRPGPAAVSLVRFRVRYSSAETKLYLSLMTDSVVTAHFPHER